MCVRRLYRTLKGPAQIMRRSATICIGDEIDLVTSSNILDRHFGRSYIDLRQRLLIAKMQRAEIYRFAFTYRFSFWEADWRTRAREE